MSKEKYGRRSIRLKSYDYSQVGAYFVTICTKNLEMYFERYPELKSIVLREWQNLPNKFPSIELDAFVIMPNHIHGIVFITGNVGATLVVAQNKRAGTRPAPTLGNIIGAFKSLCVNKWLKYIKENKIRTQGSFWQRNYFEHIIRDEKALNRIREYIYHNPMKWELDRENPNRTGIDEFDKWLMKEGAIW